jgi:hypothetical protein
MDRSRFPTAKDTGEEVNLSLRIGAQTVSGQNVKEFLRNVLLFIDEAGLLEDLTVPFPTSGANNLVAGDARHPDGRAFVNALEYRQKSGRILYVNINHPRFFALRQGARLAAAVGLVPIPVDRDSKALQTKLPS